MPARNSRIIICPSGQTRRGAVWRLLIGRGCTPGLCDDLRPRLVKKSLSNLCPLRAVPHSNKPKGATAGHSRLGSSEVGSLSLCLRTESALSFKQKRAVETPQSDGRMRSIGKSRLSLLPIYASHLNSHPVRSHTCQAMQTMGAFSSSCRSVGWGLGSVALIGPPEAAAPCPSSPWCFEPPWGWRQTARLHRPSDPQVTTEPNTIWLRPT
jgi:hypothetical protein